MSASTATRPEAPSQTAPQPGHQRVGPSRAGWTARGSTALLVLATALFLPHLLHPVESVFLALAAIYAIIGLSVNVLLGYVGSISLGHQAFVGIGAFTSAFVVTELGQPFLVGVAVATLLGTAQACLLGLVSLRVTGLYFALVTLAYGLLAERTLFGIQVFTGGTAGQPAPMPTGVGNYIPYFYLCLLFLALVLWVDVHMTRSKAGRAMLALRTSPDVAASFGVNVKAYTLLAFAVAGAYAGLAGALFAHLNERVDSTDFTFELALVFVIMTVVGGLRSRAGIVIGSALFAVIDLVIDKIPGLETALRELHVTIPVLVLVLGASAAIKGWRRHGRAQMGIAAIAAFVALLVLLPPRIPGIEAVLEGLPLMTADIFTLIKGPVILLHILLVAPGGIGQLLRPAQRWLAGGPFERSAGHDAHSIGVLEGVRT